MGFLSNSHEREMPLNANQGSHGLNFRRTRKALVASCLSVFMMMTAQAADKPAAAPKGYDLERPEIKAFIDDLVKQENFSRIELVTILGQAKKSNRVLDLISRPAEKRLEWKDYRKIFMTDERVSGGLNFWKDHAKTLAMAEEQYGVPAEIIVSIIGVETYYGRLTGGFRVLDALSTLSFDYPPRSKFFTQQLREFLILSREQKFEPYDLTGSYAGAMGIPQFMPSSYRAYAVDFTGDGQSDIWKKKEDAIGSVANYLKENGWQRGKLIASKASVQGTQFEKALSSSVRPKKTVQQLEETGWSPEARLPSTTKAAPFKLEGTNGTEYWLGLENFRVITTYNRSRLYAMAVYQLAKEVKADYKASLPKKKSEPQVTKS